MIAWTYYHEVNARRSSVAVNYYNRPEVVGPLVEALGRNPFGVEITIEDRRPGGKGIAVIASGFDVLLDSNGLVNWIIADGNQYNVVPSLLNMCSGYYDEAEKFILPLIR